MGGRSVVPSLPIGPPAGRSVSLNGIPHPFSSKPPKQGPALHDCWNAHWHQLPPSVRTTFTAWGSTSPPSAELQDRSAPSSQGWTPTIQDPLAEAFPWASLTVFGSPLPTASTSFVRQQLQARRGPRRPKWPELPGSALDESAWKDIWARLRRLPLSALVRTTSVLILNKNVWTYHDKDGDGNRRCPAGCGGDDGVHHGSPCRPAHNGVGQGAQNLGLTSPTGGFELQQGMGLRGLFSSVRQRQTPLFRSVDPTSIAYSSRGGPLSPAAPYTLKVWPSAGLGAPTSS
ncbi:unnamed protein product [Tilletia controversa]|nr:unnamed protein product [Tilletia controversa]